MNNFLVYAGIGVLGLHMLVIYQVWRSDDYTPGEKFLSGLVVVLLPFFGALLVLLQAASQRMNPVKSNQTSYN